MMSLPSDPVQLQIGPLTVSLTDFGGRGDGVTDNTEAFRQAIRYCHQAGGGTVQIPPGHWLTGPIHFQSFVRLHLEKDAVIEFDSNPDRYLPVVFTRWEGVECYNYSPLIYAYQCEHIAITGSGEIHGNGQAWWPWKQTQRDAAERLYLAESRGIPVSRRVFGEPGGLRPPLFQCVESHHVLLDGITFIDGPQWTIHPVYCENVLIRNVTVLTNGPNTDGLNPDSCRNVWVEGCRFATGDDCIAINSGMNEDGWRVNRPSENIYIENCVMTRGHGGVVIGSGMSGGVRNVKVRHCRFDTLDRGIRLKSLRGRGGVVEQVEFDSIKVTRIRREAIVITTFYESSTVPPISSVPPRFQKIRLRNIEGQSASVGISLQGLPDQPLEDIYLENVTLSELGTGLQAHNVKNVVFHQVTLHETARQQAL